MYYFEDETLTEQERKDLKSKALNNSRIFNKFFWPDFLLYPEIEALTKQLIKEIKILPIFDKWKQERKLERSMAVLLIDLLKNHLEDKTQYLAFYRDNNYYVIKRLKGTKKAERVKSPRTGTVYNPVSVGRKIINIVDCLIELGYIENHTGIRANGSFKKGRVSRIRATPQLLVLIDDYSINENTLSAKPTTENVLIFRDCDKNDIEYEENEKIIAVKNLLMKYNNLLEETYIDINLSGNPLEGVNIKKLPVKINLNNKFYKRVFNNIESEDGEIISAGGRYYGHFTQHIPSKLRERIMMGDPPESTVEIDFSTMHPLILASFNNVSFDNDPYTIPDYSDSYRPLFKLILLVLINSTSKDNAVLAIEKEVREESDYEDFRRLNLVPIINKFEKFHSNISNHFYTNAGLKCQNIEASICSNIIRIFTSNNKYLLTIHDSFICQENDSQFLIDTMKESFKQVLILKGLDPVEAKLKTVVKDFVYSPDQDMDRRYNRWKHYNKQIQFKRILINNK